MTDPGQQEYHIAAPRDSGLRARRGGNLFHLDLKTRNLKVGADTLARAVASIGAVDLSFAVLSTGQVRFLPISFAFPPLQMFRQSDCYTGSVEVDVHCVSLFYTKSNSQTSPLLLSHPQRDVFTLWSCTGDQKITNL